MLSNCFSSLLFLPLGYKIWMAKLGLPLVFCLNGQAVRQELGINQIEYNVNFQVDQMVSVPWVLKWYGKEKFLVTCGIWTPF